MNDISACTVQLITDVECILCSNILHNTIIERVDFLVIYEILLLMCDEKVILQLRLALNMLSMFFSESNSFTLSHTT